MSGAGLWGGRFSEQPSQLFKRFNDSFPFDVRLLHADIKGSEAYAKGLRARNVLSEEEASKLADALDDIGRCYPDASQLDRQTLSEHEDVHAFVEAELVKRVGDIGKKLHTARSRNDQVATDLRIYGKGQVEQTIFLIQSLQATLIKRAEEYPDLSLPGYTHMQKAQPILWSHYLLSFVEMFERDISRFRDCFKRMDSLPLGSGALAGNSQAVDRELLARELGFSQLSRNSLDATSDRDFVVEFMAASSLFLVHLSRLAEDFILYCSSEFAYLEMSDQVATGSSLMPQKKNPDALELLRGKSGRVFGHLNGMLSVLKGLPSCYNKDLQEDKEGFFDCIDTVQLAAQVADLVVGSVLVRRDRMQAAVARGYLNATEFADYLVDKGIPFRTAHHLVGEIVVFAIKSGRELHELELFELQNFHPDIAEDVFQSLSIAASLSSKASLGGTSPQRVREAIDFAKARMPASFFQG